MPRKSAISFPTVQSFPRSGLGNPASALAYAFSEPSRPRLWQVAALQTVGGPTTIAVGSEEARLRAGLRPPLKLHVRVSRMQLLRRLSVGGV
jgi:hypothetical protein